MGSRLQLPTVFSHYFTNYYRSRSFYVMLAMILLVSFLMSYFTLRYSSHLPPFLGGGLVNNLPAAEKIRFFSAIWAFILLDVPVFASVFFGSPSISSEIENKTAYHIFSLPIGRYTLLTGKYLAAFAVTFIIISIYMGFEASVMAFVFHAMPAPAFYMSYAMLSLFILAVLSLTFLISSIFSKNIYAYITVFILYFLIFNVITIILELIYGYNAYFLLNNAADIVQKVFVNVSLTRFSSGGSIAPAGMNEVATSAIVMILYAVVSFVAALFIFEKREAR